MNNGVKVALINPIFEGTVFAPSLGLGFIGTYLKEHNNCEVQVIEPLLQGLTKAQVLNMVKESKVVGLTCYTESRFEVFKFALEVKKMNPNCVLVVGGPHINSLDKEVLQHYPFVDIVVRGEGEETTSEIVDSRTYGEVLGITWRRTNGEVVRNPGRTVIKDIDTLHYDYSLLPGIEDWKDLEVPRRLGSLRALPIVASRGCPFQCTFCAAHEQWGKIYRVLSPEELVKRLEVLVDKYNVGYFRFYDSLFMLDERKVLKFCDLLQESKLEITFRIDARTGISREVLKRLREVGCTVVGMGIESGSNSILNRINKGITREQIERKIQMCKDLGYWTIGYFMVSLPGETIKDFEETLELPKLLEGINLQFFKIHPNTAIYSELKLRGEINDNVWFNPGYGLNTMCGNEVYYCKELFPSAGFSLNEGETLLHRVYYNYYTHNPKRTFQRFGVTKGIPTLLLSTMMDKILLRSKMGRTLYGRLQRTNLPKIFYGWLTKKKVGKVGW